MCDSDLEEFSVSDYIESDDSIHETTPNKPILNNVSEEQYNAISHIINGDNVVVDSVSGSGKSTTILSCAKMMPTKRFLQITYNASLRKDVLQKVESLGLTNIVVHTFHSLAVKYYLSTAHTDTGIRKIMFDKCPPREKLPEFDVIVLDEAQDMTFLYYQFIIKFAFDMSHKFQIFILGDYMQALYQFKGSDERFLTFADIIWEKMPLLKNNIFHKCSLKTSYRITNQMADFVNHAMLGESRLIACKEGDPVVYIRNSRRNLEKIVISQINLLLEAGESPNNIFVLGASVKGINSNIRKMENFLVEKNIPCYVPMFETEKIDEKVIEGKVVFSTFHSVKGRERPYVFIMGFDQTYFDFYASNLSYDVCPNTLYVGCTRATHKLFLLESDQYTTDRPLQFLKLNHYQMREKPYIHFKGIPRSVFYVQNKDIPQLTDATKVEYHDVTPTDLIKFVPEVVIEQISPLLDRIFVCEKEAKPENEIPIPTMIQTSRGLYEDVSDLNGIAIPSIYYDHIQKLYDPDSDNIGANILLSIIRNTMEETKDYEYSYLKEIIAMLPDDCTTPGEYLFLSNVFVATKEKLYFKLKQIEERDYTWLTDEIIEACIKRLDETIGQECIDSNKENSEPPLIEHTIINAQMDNEIERINHILKPFFPDYKKKFRFTARTDLITDKCIWELKCTSSISIEHQLQVIIYEWLWFIVNNPSLGNPLLPPLKKTQYNTKPMRIFNIKTGEILLLNASFDELTHIVVSLLKGKYADVQTKTDEEFIDDALNFLTKYI